MIKLVPGMMGDKRLVSLYSGDEGLLMMKWEVMTELAAKWLAYRDAMADNDKHPSFITAALAQIAIEALAGEESVSHPE